MMPRVPAFLFLLVVAVFLRPAAGIDCYSCTSEDEDCKEVPNEVNLVFRGLVQSGCTSCSKTFSALGTIWTTVARGCNLAGTTSSCTNVLDYGTCTCTTTHCNGGFQMSASTFTLLLVAVFYFLIDG